MDKKKKNVNGQKIKSNSSKSKRRRKEKVYMPENKDELLYFRNYGDISNDSVITDLYTAKKIHTKPKKKTKKVSNASRVTVTKLSKEEMDKYIEALYLKD